ncbi:MAG: hypothetical protein ACE5OZ_16995 [Candidatus Heimdallarchaeota archaeon]
MTQTRMIAGLILLLSMGMIVCLPSSGKVYYKAAEGDIVNVNYQRYEADGTEQDGGALVVFLGDGAIPLELQEQYPDAITVVRGFWKIIAGGTTTARDYGDGMQEGDKKEWQRVPAADGYISSSHELYGESLYFDVELLSIFYDAAEEPFGTEQSNDPWGLDDFLKLPFVMPILVLIGLAVLSIVGYKLHGQTRRFMRGRVHCSCGAVATMECARCFTKSCRECFLKHSGCHKCGSNKMVPLR